MVSLVPPPVYPSNASTLPTKMRPGVPGATSRPSPSKILTTDPGTTPPTQAGSAARSAGVAMVA